jgi:hypothetical protein
MSKVLKRYLLDSISDLKARTFLWMLSNQQIIPTPEPKDVHRMPSEILITQIFSTYKK